MTDLEQMKVWLNEHQEVRIAVASTLVRRELFGLDELYLREPGTFAELFESMESMLKELPMERLSWD